MIFDLEEKPGTRFDMEGGGWVELRALTAEDWAKITKATVTIRPFAHKDENGKYIVLNGEVVNSELQAEMINDLSIVAWGDLLDGKEKPIPCNKKMKTVLMRMKDPRFRNFVNEKLPILNGIQKERQEEAEKNL